jgi:hypothetical protein
MLLLVGVKLHIKWGIWFWGEIKKYRRNVVKESVRVQRDEWKGKDRMNMNNATKGMGKCIE